MAPSTKNAFLYTLLQVTTLLVGVYGNCPLQDGALPSVPNGYRVNVANLTLYTDGTAAGFFDIDCNPGFALDPSIGGRITCLDSGQWSTPLPVCNSMGSCPVQTLFDFIGTSVGLTVDQSQNFVSTNGVDDSQALGGSNITLQCQDGYTNLGGPLTVVCTDQNTWTPFPQCVSTTTTTQAPARCPYTNDTLTFANGYVSDATNLLLYSDNTAQGSLVVTCSPGFVVDSVSGGVFSCNAGVWSSPPSCTKTNRCSLTTLENFLNDSSLAVGLQIVSQQMPTVSGDNDTVLIGSYVQLACSTGLINTDGNLNVTCNDNGQWSAFPSCVAQIGGSPSRCPLQNGTLPTVASGSPSSTANIIGFSDGTASGYYDITCNPGFALDPIIGGRISCLDSGQWSTPLPTCTSLGSCLIQSLSDFIGTSVGMTFDPSQDFVFTNGVDQSQALGGSNVTVQCQDGYTNVGGALTIVCTSANTWTPFPQCVPISTVTSSTAAPDTTSSTVDPALLRCPYTSDTLQFPGSRSVDTSNLALYSDNTAAGSLMVQCSSGYAMDAISGGVFSCNAGFWSSRPSCTKTARCSLQALQALLNDPVETEYITIVSENISVDNGDSTAVLPGSSISFACQDGFSLVGGTLNVSCNDQGQWDQFPSCVANPTTPTI